MKLNCISKKIAEEIIKEKISATGNKVCASGGNQAHTYNHRYVCVDVGQTQYLLSFNRLWCDRSKHIHNSFGQAQFMCYPTRKKIEKNVGGINLFPISKEAEFEFKMMYPGSDRDGNYNGEGKNFAYNAPYDINDDSKEVAECFSEFIGWCEKLCKNNEAAELKNDAEFIKWCKENEETA